MATIIFRVSAKADKNTGLHEILVRFFHGRIDLYGKTNVFINPEHWNPTTQRNTIPRVRIMTDENKSLIDTLSTQNANLDNLAKLIQSDFIERGAGKVALPKGWLQDLINTYYFPNANDEEPRTLFDEFQRFIDTKTLGESRKRHYSVVKRALQRFAIYNGIDITFDNLTTDTIREFRSFIEIEHTLADPIPVKRGKRGIEFANASYEKAFKAVPESRLPAPRGENAIIGILTKVRTFVLWCIDEGLMTTDPFKNYEIGNCIYGTPFYLTIEERNKLYTYDFGKNKTLSIQRDIFVFQCLIGCRVSDLKRLKKSSIVNGAIEYIPRKTKNDRAIVVRVPLNKIANEIVERYQDTPGEQLLPCHKFDQDYNEDIKQMCRIAGLKRVVTTLNPTTREEEQHPLWEVASSQIARRCFVGNLYKQVKDPNLVGKLSGHKEGSRAFARYRDIDEETTKELVAMLEG